MADKEISDFPELSTLNNDDVVLASSSGNTFKVKGSTIKEACSIHVELVRDSIPAGRQYMYIKAPNVTGYTFICWIDAFWGSVYTALTIPAPEEAHTAIWSSDDVTSREVPFVAIALYSHN